MNAVRRWSIAGLTCLLICSMVVSAYSQDPFSEKPKSDAAEAVELLRKARQDSEDAAQQMNLEKLHAQNAKLRSQLDQIALKLAEVDARNRDILNSNAALNQEMRVFKEVFKRLELGSDQFIALNNNLLNSDNVSDQLRGLETIRDCLETVDDSGTRYLPVDTRTIELLCRLLDSPDKQINTYAMISLINIKPTTALEYGFQRHDGYWKPVVLGTGGRLNASLTEPADFDYDETPLVDVIEEIRDAYNINIQLGKGVDPETPVTYRAQDLPLVDQLFRLTEKYELAVSTDGNLLQILKSSSPEAIKTFTYNVRGLLTEKLTIEGVEELVVDDLGFTVKVKVIDKHRVVVTAKFPVHRKVSKLLGSLPQVDLNY